MSPGRRRGERRVETDGVQRVRDPGGPIGLVEAATHIEPLGDGIAHGDVGVEAAQRILEDVLHDPLTPERAQGATPEACEIPAVDGDLAREDACQPEERARDRRLAGTGLPDEPHGLARRDAERDTLQHRLPRWYPTVASRNSAMRSDMRHLLCEDGRVRTHGGRRGASACMVPRR